MINADSRVILNRLVLVLKIGRTETNMTILREIITDLTKIITARLLTSIQSSNSCNIVTRNSFNSYLNYLLISYSSFLLFL
jgi:hypothetical protein